jgi:hypothetical protein
VSDSEIAALSESTRRRFLILAGASAAAVGTVTLAPAAAAPRQGQGEPSEPMTDLGPLVAYVSDVRNGEVSVMMGEREVLIRDHQLCASLVRALA